LRALLIARAIAELRLDRVRHRFQHLQGLFAVRVGHDTAGPGIDLSVGVRHLAFGKAREIGNLMGVVGKWKQLSSFVKAVDWKRLAVGVMRHIERRYDAELPGPER